MKFSNFMPARSRRRPLWSVVLASVLLVGACTSSNGSGPAGADSDQGSPAAPDGATATTEPSGRPLTTDSEFDREPCAVASATEMRDALDPPFNAIAGELLVPEGPPVVIDGDDAGPGGAAGCEYRLLAEGTDTSEAYHLITVTVVRLESGGPELMLTCQDAAAAAPLTYRVLDLADSSCVGPGAVLSLLVGGNHYSVTTAAIPGRADQTDEDLRLGTLSEAAGTVLADCLPAT